MQKKIEAAAKHGIDLVLSLDLGNNSKVLDILKRN